MSENITLLEKFQPTALSDIHGHDTIRKILMKMVEQQNIPHLMFTGEPGNGKSTTAMALIQDLYGDDYKSNYIKFDASTDRGIDTIRGRVKEATKYRSLNHNFKIILLEESDELTSQAQFALREIMLKNQAITRFIYINNNLNKIIGPIQDRCQIFRFAPLVTENIITHLNYIIKEENISITSAQVRELASVSNGSMRNAVNGLQTVATQEEITDDLIKTIMGSKFDNKDASKILEYVFAGEQGKWEQFIFNLVYKSGFTPDEIMGGILDKLISDNDPKNMKIILLLSEFHYRMSQGASPMIQLRVALAKLSSMKKP